MTDSDEESEFGSGVNLTGFLFGNVDEDGHLDNDVFDSETQKHLASLGKLGLGSLLREMIGDDSPQADSDSDSDEQKDDKTSDQVQKETEVSVEKLSSAVDFSDITELAEDLNIETISKITTKDNELMPPPPLPKSTENISTSSDNKDTSEEEEMNKKKLDTPLAAMLPSKYANVDVTELFPDFRPGKVLRFSRLFGPGKPSSLPNIWRNVRKKRKKRHRRNSDKERHHAHDSDASGSDDDHHKRRNRGWSFDYAPEPGPGDEGRMPDDEAKFLMPSDIDPSAHSARNSNARAHDGSGGGGGPKVADWRFGPAQMWYDMLEVSETGDDFNYGFKLTDNAQRFSAMGENKGDEGCFPDDAFLMVTQLHWEDDVVWDGNDIKAKVSAKLNSKSNAAGWVPSSGNRTAQAFSQPGKGSAVLPVGGGTGSGRLPPIPAPPLPGSKSSNKNNVMSKPMLRQEEPDDTWYSIFPVENEDLVYGKWEDDVIWDSESIDHIPKPSILTLDSNDENIILGVPDDIDPSKQIAGQTPAVKVKIPHPHVKKSKILLGKAGVINVLQEDTPPPPPKSPDRDPFNISNDIYYMPRSSESSMRLKVGGGNLIQHSTPVVELRAPFVPTHMGPIRLRNFHRPPMKRFGNGTLATPGPHTVLPLLKHIRKKAKSREAERMASGGGDVFFMRSPGDLTGRDGDLILVEYIEEHPPLMSLVGMCSKIKNYYKRKAGKDQGPPAYRFGETAYAHTSPFLGILSPGQSMQAVESNMYRAPIYEHKLPETDFLVIRTREQYYIREIESLFLAGQECPLYEVPGPNSKRANNFVRDFLQVFIYRLFWKSRDSPRRIRMDDIKNAFPSHSESSIRKRLKLCADFKRTGMDSNWWVIKPEFRLPTEEEIRAMVSPEQCCAYFSMVAAEQRLKDAGYGEKFLFTPAEDDDEEMQLKMDDEIKVAPWNTTRAYIQAMKGKCLLQLAGPADPTGCGEGFSYVRVPNKPTQSKEEQESQPKRTVTGTDADLRRLSLNNAKALLRKFGVPEDEIKRLTRWEVIDVVRTLSTEKAKAGEEGMDKFSRGNRFSIAEHQERYKEECQRIFDLQNRVLASEEVLSTDEGESSDEDSDEDIEEMGKNIENMLANKKTSSQLSLEREEQERQELRKMIMEGEDKKCKDKSKIQKDVEDELDQSYAQQGRVLRICRTFRDQDGREYTRVETVRKPAVIDAYVRIRKTKDEQFIRQFATLDEAQKEEMKREKRRIQEQLRRIKRNQERERLALRSAEFQQNVTTLSSGGNNPSSTSHPIKPVSSVPLTGLSINTSYDLDGNTGAREGGATSTSRERDRETPSLFKERSHNKSLTPEKKLSSPIREGRSSLSPGLSSSKHSSNSPSKSSRRRTKLKPDLKLKCGACGNVGHMRTNKACPLYQATGGLEFPPGHIPSGNTGNGSSMSSSLSSSNIGETLTAVNAVEKKRPININGNNRETIVSNLTICGQTVTMIEEQVEELDIKPICSDFDDEDLVNVDGTKVKLSGKVLKHAEEMKKRSLLLKVSRDSLGNNRKRRRQTSDPHCDYLKRHNRTANRRRTDPVVVLSTILENILNELRDLPDVQPFLFPVNPKLVMDYHRIIQRPMDLQTIREHLRQKKYQSREEFLSDINQIVVNSSLYNGAKSSLTTAAQRLLQKCVERLAEKEDRLMRLEKAINPLLDDNDQVALTFILDNVVNTKLKGMQESWPFLKPVNKKMVKDYYSVIKRPMDLETIAKKVAAHKYHSRHDFLVDIQQILENCTLYNGHDSNYTQKAELLVKVCKATLDEYADHLSQLEGKIALARERAAQDHHNDDMEEDDDDLDDDDLEELQPSEDNYTISEPATSHHLLHDQYHGGGGGGDVSDDILSVLSGAPTAALVNQSTGGHMGAVLLDLDPDYVDIEGTVEAHPDLQQLTVVGGENADGVAVAHPGGGLSAAFMRTHQQLEAPSIGGTAQQRTSTKRHRASNDAATLEEDLQCSSEDDDDDDGGDDDTTFQRHVMDDIMAAGEDNDDLDDLPEVKREITQLGEGISSSLVEGEDDSQQVAEAMVQLGTIGYYNQSEHMLQQEDNQLISYDQRSSGSQEQKLIRAADDLDLDPDPDYDPSEDFLSSHRATVAVVKREDMDNDVSFEREQEREREDIKPKIHDDLAVSDSDPDEEDNPERARQLIEQERKFVMQEEGVSQHMIDDQHSGVNIRDAVDVDMLDDDDVWF